jgi:hypothetical protein
MLDRVPEEALDLLSRLLCPSGRRLSMHAVLLHPWVQEELDALEEGGVEEEEEEDGKVGGGSGRGDGSTFSCIDGSGSVATQAEGLMKTESKVEGEEEDTEKQGGQEAAAAAPAPIPFQDVSNMKEVRSQAKQADENLHTPLKHSRQDGFTTSGVSRRLQMTPEGEEENTGRDNAHLFKGRWRPATTSQSPVARSAPNRTAIETVAELAAGGQRPGQVAPTPTMKSPPWKRRALHSASP